MELGQDHDLIARVQNKIRIVPDFPKPNTRFRDLSQVVESDPDLFRAIIDSMANRHRASRQDRILCIESWVTFLARPWRISWAADYAWRAAPESCRVKQSARITS